MSNSETSVDKNINSMVITNRLNRNYYKKMNRFETSSILVIKVSMTSNCFIKANILKNERNFYLCSFKIYPQTRLILPFQNG